MSNNTPIVRQLAPGEEGDWDRFVRSSPFGTLFHLTDWARVVQGVLEHSTVPLVATRGDQITGVFPISHVRRPWFRDCLISMPLSVYGGICAKDLDSHAALLNAAAGLARRLKVSYLEMRNREEPFPSGLPGRSLYVTFTQDLSPGPEALFAGLPRDTRYAIRKSQKSGLNWTEDSDETDFYDIYAHSLHRLGTPMFPLKLFTTLRGVLRERVRIFSVRKAEKAIASVMCFYFGKTVMPYYGGSLSGYEKESPNNFMYWSLIAQSCKEGFRTFDFGRSKRGTGSYRFKSAWSMVETELPYRYQLVKAADVPHLSPVDRKFQLPIAAWRRLPFAWTKVVGPQVLRWIPSI